MPRSPGQHEKDHRRETHDQQYHRRRRIHLRPGIDSAGNRGLFLRLGIEKNRTLELTAKRLIQIIRRAIPRKLPKRIALLRQIRNQLAVLRIIRKVLFNLGAALRVELSVDVSTKLGLDVFRVCHGSVVSCQLPVASCQLSVNFTTDN